VCERDSTTTNYKLQKQRVWAINPVHTNPPSAIRHVNVIDSSAVSHCPKAVYYSIITVSWLHCICNLQICILYLYTRTSTVLYCGGRGKSRSDPLNNDLQKRSDQS
jgi:hypothetical protein